MTFYFESANPRRGFRWGGQLIDFTPCASPLGLVGVFKTDDESLASVLRAQSDRGVSEISMKSFLSRMRTENQHVSLSRFYDAIDDRKAIDAAIDEKNAVPSFLEQTKWDCGLFTTPAGTELTVHYNCSIVAYEGKRFLFTRRHRYWGGQMNESDIAIFRIRKNMTLQLVSIPELPKRFQGEQWEDPRAVIGTNKLCYVACATWLHGETSFSIRQSLLRLSPDWRRAYVVAEPEYGGNTPQPTRTARHEKNWIWFEHEGVWHFIYSIVPHVVVRAGLEWKIEKQHSTKVEFPWTHGEPRGGTPPIRIGDEYLCFFHSAVPWRPQKRRYFMGAYAFQAKPPFKITRYTPEPLLIGSENDFRSLNSPLVIFPNGALLEGQELLVVFGVNDEHCGWIKIPVADLNKRMKKA